MQYATRRKVAGSILNEVIRLPNPYSRIYRPCSGRRYQIFWEVVGLKWVPLSLVSTIKELLGRKNSGFGLETENTAVGTRHADHVASSIRKRWH
jgi:hypothetical protein